jgi:hypothetical protein
MKRAIIIMAIVAGVVFPAIGMAQDKNRHCTDSTSYLLQGDMGQQNMKGSHQECGAQEDKWNVSCKWLPKEFVTDSATGKKKLRLAGCYVCYSDFTNMTVGEVAQAVIAFSQTYAANTNGRVWWPKERDVFDWGWCSVCPR